MGSAMKLCVFAFFCSLGLCLRSTLSKGDPKLAKGDTKAAMNHRKGILFFLKSLKVSTGILDGRDGLKLAKDAKAAKQLAEDYGPALKEATTKNIKKAGKMVKDKKSILYKVVKAGKELIKKMVGAFTKLGGFAAKAAKAASKWLLAVLPDIVGQFMTLALKELATGIEVISIVKDLGGAVVAAWDTWQSRNLLEGIKPGIPTAVIKSVRKQIKAFGISGFISALADSLVLALKVLAPGGGHVVGVIKTIFSYVAEVFFHYRDLWRLDGIILNAGIEYEAQSYLKPKKFSKWYFKVIEDMPIVASYCLAMPMTGSYEGFLAATSKNGLPIPAKELNKNLKDFKTAKGWAKSFVKSHSVKLYSKDPQVKQDIKLVQGSGSINMIK